MLDSSSEPSTDPINWDNITSENEEDPIKALLEKTPSKEISAGKKPRGRPKKPPTPVETSVPPVIPETPLSQQTAESMLTNSELLKILSNSQSDTAVPSTRGKKSSLRFSGDKGRHDNETPETVAESDDPERTTLKKLYKQYFKEPLISRHKRKEKTWTEANLNSEIYREIRELETACSDEDPAAILGGVWVAGMGAIEALGPTWGLETQGLTKCCHIASQQADFRSNMRELLIKYPYLRTMIGLGGYPELKLILMTATIVKEVHRVNTQPRGPTDMSFTDDTNSPTNLRQAFENL